MIPKFRAWDSTWEEWLANIFVDSKGCLYEFGKDTSYGKAINKVTRNNVFLMQSTGFFDKNGKEIFEGDVVKFNDSWAEYGYEGYVDGISEGEK